MAHEGVALHCVPPHGVPGAGKSGDVRVICFYVAAQAQARMLLIYRNGGQDSLTAAEKKILRKLNETW